MVSQSDHDELSLHRSWSPVFRDSAPAPNFLMAADTVAAPYTFHVRVEISSAMLALKCSRLIVLASSTWAHAHDAASSTAITIAEQTGLDYMVVITSTEDPGGNLGEVWVTNDSTTQFTVHNSGTATTGFRYKVFPGAPMS